MKAAIALFLFVGPLFVAPAFAQSNRHIAYQNALLARGLAPADQALCDAKAGGPGPDYDACRVTRLFLADIAGGRDSGFPPLTDIKYASKAETTLILDRMTKYGG